VLSDALHRVSAVGGRDGMPWSLRSVYGAAVARFLSRGLRGTVVRAFDVAALSQMNGVAVSLDGATLLMSDALGGSNGIHVLSAVDGSLRRVVSGDASLFRQPYQVCIARDGCVFVADGGRHRVQVRAADVSPLAVMGEGLLRMPMGIAATSDVVAVSECDAHRVTVFNRRDGSLRRRFGCLGSGDGQLHCPAGLCLTSGDRHVAVADHDNHRVSVFTVDGGFVRHVGAGVLSFPVGVASSSFDELVVADYHNCRLRLFSASGELLLAFGPFGSGWFSGVALHEPSGSVFAPDFSTHVCSVFQ
jgi:hypothetical protein